MILIIANEWDKTAKDVYHIITQSQEAFLMDSNQSLIEFIDLYGDLFISLSHIQAIWFRKLPFAGKGVTTDKLPFNLNNQLVNEFRTIYRYFLFWHGPTLSGALENPNKLEILTRAKECNIKTPTTAIVSNKSQLLKFFKKHHQVITKPISEVIYVDFKSKRYSQHTKRITKEEAENLPEFKFPSLVQEYIRPKVELRIFYLEPDLFTFSIAVDNKFIDSNIVDVRKNNGKDWSLNYIKLNIEETAKIEKLCKVLGYQTCSIDAIVSNDDKLIFIELNPSGEFSYFSKAFNLDLEGKIAQKLISISNNATRS